MKLEVKHLAPYLPYSLKMRNEAHKTLLEEKGQIYHDSKLNSISVEGHLFIGKRGSSVHISNQHWKPVLVPLSKFKDFDSENWNDIEISFLQKYEIYCFANGINKYTEIGVGAYEICLFNHIDIFGLIPTGLAVEK